MSYVYKYNSTLSVGAGSPFDSELFWYDSGNLEGGQILYNENVLGTYAAWYDGSNWVLSLEADAGGSPTNYYISDTAGVAGIASAYTGHGTFATYTLTMSAVAAHLTEWEWNDIRRNRDYSIVRSKEFYRSNWQLVRSRLTNLPYSSELGEDESSLSGYNGGVTETITPPTFNSTQFLQSFAAGAYWQNITNAAAEPPNLVDPVNYGLITTLVGLNFFTAQWKHQDKDVFISVEPSPVRFNEVVVIFWEDGAMGAFSLATNNCEWHAVSLDSSLAHSGDLGTYASVLDYMSQNGEATLTDTKYICGWKQDATHPSATSPLLASYVGEADMGVTFKCVSDTQVYDQRGVDWYKQTQVWVAKSPWV